MCMPDKMVDSPLPGEAGFLLGGEASPQGSQLTPPPQDVKNNFEIYTQSLQCFFGFPVINNTLSQAMINN